MRPPTFAIAYALFATSLSGCFGGCDWGWEDDGSEWTDCSDPSTPGCETFPAPEVTFFIPSWPPIGPEGELTIHAESDAGLAEVDLSFGQTTTRFLSGALTSDIRVTGVELGEGFGTLDVTVFGEDGGWTHRQVEDLLVDLSEPEAYFEQTVLPAAGATLDFWIADAWVVSSYDLTIGDKSFFDTLPEGYPSTLGTEWDYSLVRIPVEDLPLGTTTAALTVRDAAGNAAFFDLSVTVDGVAPTAAFVAPLEGETVSATFEVSVDAADELGGVVDLELSIGGALWTTLVGPSATVTLDASELPAGPVELSVVAIDEAGNRSAPVVRSVTVGTEQ